MCALVANERFEIKAFETLTLHELYEIMHLRDRVFVVGQKITAVSEIDGLDPECEHAMLWRGDALIGTARIFHQRMPRSVGRVAVDTTLQRQGIGSRLMRGVQAHLGEAPAELHAQAHLEAWYARLGWRRVGEVFIEAEIPHVTMVWMMNPGEP